MFLKTERKKSISKNIQIRVGDRASGSLSNDYDDGSENVSNKFAFLKNSVVVIPTRIKFKI